MFAFRASECVELLLSIEDYLPRQSSAGVSKRAIQSDHRSQLPKCSQSCIRCA